MLKICGIVEPGDWVLDHAECIMRATFTGMSLLGAHVDNSNKYRALDLMSEVFESAGAAVLCAGPDMHHHDIVDAIAHFRVNTISGDVGHLIQLAKYVATLSEEKRKSLHVTKALYPSGAIAPSLPAQRSFLFSVFGDIAPSSVIGSAEVVGGTHP